MSTIQTRPSWDGKPLELPSQRSQHTFWSRVAKTATCWLWQGRLDKGGYGRFSYGQGKRAARLAHRISWLLVRGQLPVGMDLLHNCDNHACVNPSHMRLGTQQQNVADMVERKRQAPSVLTEEQARAARFGRESLTALARKFGVSFWSLRDARRGRTWQWLQEAA